MDLTSLVSEKLIPLEDSDNEDSSMSFHDSAHNKYSSEADFNQEINRLKQQSTKKFQEKWHEILQKYAEIDDDLESDEIDLATGSILTDNGHLRSMNLHSGSPEPNIWDDSYDSDLERKKTSRAARRRVDQKRRLKLSLKESQKFYNANAVKLPSPLKSDHESPFKDIPEDNLLLINPSPTKKRKSVPMESPSKISFRSLDLNAKPARPIFETSDIHASRIVDDDDVTLSEEEEAGDSEPEDKEDVEEDKEDSEPEDSESGDSESDSTHPNSNPFYIPDSQRRSNLDFQSNGKASSDSDESDEVTSKSAELSTPNIQYIYGLSEPSSLNCPFGCTYSNKETLVRQHLLLCHAAELKGIGYPVKSSTLKSTVPGVLHNVTQNFPLHFNIPPVPETPLHNPLHCNLLIAGQRCTRMFLNDQDMSEHQKSYPHSCTTTPQILACPLLGCEFTSKSYLVWRRHFIDAKHYVKSSPSKKSLKPDHTRTPSTTDIKKEIDDLFNDG